jgi:hypothetical protein
MEKYIAERNADYFSYAERNVNRTVHGVILTEGHRVTAGECAMFSRGRR